MKTGESVIDLVAPAERTSGPRWRLRSNRQPAPTNRSVPCTKSLARMSRRRRRAAGLVADGHFFAASGADKLGANLPPREPSGRPATAGLRLQVELDAGHGRPMPGADDRSPTTVGLAIVAMSSQSVNRFPSTTVSRLDVFVQARRRRSIAADFLTIMVRSGDRASCAGNLANHRVQCSSPRPLVAGPCRPGRARDSRDREAVGLKSGGYNACRFHEGPSNHWRPATISTTPFPVDVGHRDFAHVRLRRCRQAGASESHFICLEVLAQVATTSVNKMRPRYV